MRVNALEELEYAFAEWRRGKKHVRERMPEELLARARRATEKHGVTAVVRVTGVERARLFRTRRSAAKTPVAASTKRTWAPRSVPAFSRLELKAPAAPLAPRPRPVAEVETRSGVTLRVFDVTPEMLGLLSAACGFGGGR